MPRVDACGRTHHRSKPRLPLPAEGGLKDAERTLFLRVNDAWRLRDLPFPSTVCTSAGTCMSIVLDDDEGPGRRGVARRRRPASAGHPQVCCPGRPWAARDRMDLPEDLSVRVSRHISRPNVSPPNRWRARHDGSDVLLDVGIKHPLMLIGLPGLVLFVLGIRLSGNVIDQFKELNSTSLGSRWPPWRSRSWACLP